MNSAEDIARIRQACEIAATVLEEMVRAVRPGISTFDLDRLARSLMQDFGATSASYQYRIRNHVFPSHTCISVNEEIVHGIAKVNKILKEGDNVALDVAVRYQGFIGDNARTVLVGECSENLKRLNRITEEAMWLGISKARVGNRVGDISHAIQKFVEKSGYTVVRDFVGHGIGRTMHEEPQIPNFGRPKSGPILREGMCLAIEPMVNEGKAAVDVLPDGWTAVTRDRKPSCHFEHSVLVTDGEPEILTRPSSRIAA